MRELASATQDLARMLPSRTQSEKANPTTESRIDTDMAIDEM